MKQNILTKEFLTKFRSVDSSGCWNWTRAKNSDGYGIVKEKGKTKIVSRIAYSLWFGFITEGLFVLHHCDNPGCFNPYHLFLGTQKENQVDASKKGRLRGRSLNRAKISELDVFEIKKLWAERKLTQTEIGKRFGLCQSAVSYIVNNINWRQNQ